MKKLIAKLSAVALLAALVVVPETQAASIAISATSVDANTLAITLTGLTGNVADTDDFNVTVKTLDDGTAVDISGATAFHGNDGSFAETPYNTTGLNLTADAVASAPSKVITIASATSFPTTEDYVVAVSVIGGTQNIGDFGATTVIKSTQNQVSVTATVEPTLTFNLDANSIALGTLSTSYATGNVTFDAGTNATGGVDVTVAATGLTDGTNGIGQTDLAGAEVASTHYMISTNAAPVFTDTNDGIASVGGESVVASQTVHNGAGPETISNQLVTIGAKITTATPAGSYADTLTFSATATF